MTSFEQIFEEARMERWRAQDGIIVTCGCVYCDVGNEAFRLRRRWVHHFRGTGKMILCNAKNIKPGS
jgi:hypothetical protein